MTCSLREVIRAHPVAAFTVFAYLFSWAFWIPVALAFPGLREGTLPVILVFTGTFGPAVSAVILSRVVAGKKGVASLGRRVIQWRVGKHWYAAAVCLPPVVILTALILFIASGHPAGSVSALVPWYLLPLAFVFSMITGGPLAEEPGWRGFALPTMLESFSPLAASISPGEYLVALGTCLFSLSPGRPRTG